MFLVREVILAGLLSNLRRENWARLQESAPGDTLLEISPNFDIHLNIFDSKCVKLFSSFQDKNIHIYL